MRQVNRKPSELVPFYQSLALQNLPETIVLEATIARVNSHIDMGIEAHIPDPPLLTDICCFRAAIAYNNNG